MQNIKVDFSKIIKEMKPLHGVNNGPVTGAEMTRNNIADFSEMGVPYSRLHDTQYPYGQDHFVDIHCIFKNFDADPYNPESYDFDMTDLYLQKIFEAGANVIYRLGESIEHLPKKYYIYPPKDFMKWAQICEGIIRHYTEGWANGFNYPIEYWEIWGEPDNYDLLWGGTDEEFFELYYVASNHLKKCFPHLKIGGYGSSGFYEITKRVDWDKSQHCMDFAENFLEYITREDKKSPLDFFSWHLYYQHPSEFLIQSAHLDKLLSKYGFNDTENIITEWNVSGSFMKKEPIGGALCGAIDSCIMSELQRKTNVKIATYYDVGSQFWNGLYTTNSRLKGFYSFKFYNELYKLKNEAETVEETESENIFCCAASDGKMGGVIVSNIGEKETVKLTMKGLAENTPVTAEVYYTDEEHDGELIKCEIFSGEIYSLMLKLEKATTVFVKIRKSEKEEL